MTTPSAPSPPAGAAPGLPVTFRPTRTRAVLLGVGASACAVITAIALALETLGPAERLSFILVALIFFAVLALLSRPRVTARAEGVTVVNLTFRHELEWAQIVRVNLRVGDPWVHLDLSDGTSLPALGIQPGIGRARAIADTRALRALVEEHGTPPGGG